MATKQKPKTEEKTELTPAEELKKLRAEQKREREELETKVNTEKEERKQLKEKIVENAEKVIKCVSEITDNTKGQRQILLRAYKKLLADE